MRFVTYALAFLISSFGLEIFKSLLTGSTGPESIFWIWSFIAPANFIFLAALEKNRKKAVTVNLILLLVGFLFVWAVYPQEPLMNFKRQIVSEIMGPLLIIYGIGGFLAEWRAQRLRRDQ